MRSTYLTVSLIIIAVIALAEISEALVDLEWRPSVAVVHPSSDLRFGLYAVATEREAWAIGAMEVVVLYTPSNFTFLNLNSTGAPYTWMSASFPSSAADGINKKTNDGDMLFVAWAMPGSSAIATRSGLLVTSFAFQASLTDSAEIWIPRVYGNNDTIVYDGTMPNTNVTGNLGSAKVMVVPTSFTIVNSAAEACSMAPDTLVAFAGAIVTRAFDTYFYVEDKSRACGIRINSSMQPSEGSKILVRGAYRVINGEKVIDGAVATAGSLDTIPKPVAVNSNAARTGLSPSGLLVTIAGKVKPSTNGYSFAIDDGSVSLIDVELHGVSAPSTESFVIATGALGVDAGGPVLRVNKQSDLRTY